MRALWSDRPNCSHNVSQKVKRIRRLSELWYCSFSSFAQRSEGRGAFPDLLFTQISGRNFLPELVERSIPELRLSKLCTVPFALTKTPERASTEGARVGSLRGFLILWHGFGPGFSFSGNGLRVKTQRVKTSENFSEESNLPRRFRRYAEILSNPGKMWYLLSSEKSSEISSANIFFSSAKFSEVFTLCVFTLWLFPNFGGADFCPGFGVGFFFPVPKNPRQNPHQNPCQFWNIFPTGFSGCLSLVYVSAIGCPYFHVDKPRLASLTFRARNVQWHKPEMVDSVNRFSKGKIHAKSTLQTLYF